MEAFKKFLLAQMKYSNFISMLTKEGMHNDLFEKPAHHNVFANLFQTAYFIRDVTARFEAKEVVYNEVLLYLYYVKMSIACLLVPIIVYSAFCCIFFAVVDLCYKCTTIGRKEVKVHIISGSNAKSFLTYLGLISSITK